MPCGLIHCRFWCLVIGLSSHLNPPRRVLLWKQAVHRIDRHIGLLKYGVKARMTPGGDGFDALTKTWIDNVLHFTVAVTHFEY